jgi:hypothetical protein
MLSFRDDVRDTGAGAGAELTCRTFERGITDTVP